jgi:hypothetical protein
LRPSFQTSPTAFGSAGAKRASSASEPKSVNRSNCAAPSSPAFSPTGLTWRRLADRLADDSAPEAERPQHHERSGMNQIPLQQPQGSEALRLWTATLDKKEPE